jgi:hypothetical protein
VALACAADGAAADGDASLQRLVARLGGEPWLVGLAPAARTTIATFLLTHSSRRVQRAWREFARQHRSSAQLAQAFADQGVANLDPALDAQQGGHAAEAAATGCGSVPAAAAGAEWAAAAAPDAAPEAAVPGIVMIGGLGSSSAAEDKHACFEEFAAKLQSPVTIRAAQVREGGGGGRAHKRRVCCAAACPHHQPWAAFITAQRLCCAGPACCPTPSGAAAPPGAPPGGARRECGRRGVAAAAAVAQRAARADA